MDDIHVTKDAGSKFVRLKLIHCKKEIELELPIQLARSLRSSLEAVLSGRKSRSRATVEGRKEVEETHISPKHYDFPPQQGI